MEAKKKDTNDDGGCLLLMVVAILIFGIPLAGVISVKSRDLPQEAPRHYPPSPYDPKVPDRQATAAEATYLWIPCDDPDKVRLEQLENSSRRITVSRNAPWADEESAYHIQSAGPESPYLVLRKVGSADPKRPTVWTSLISVSYQNLPRPVP